MSDTCQTSPRNSPDIPVALGLAILLLGAVVIAGWVLHVPVIVRLWPGLPAMVFNTAVGMILAGAGLACSRRFPKAHSFCSVALLVLGATTLAEYATGFDLQIDQALFQTWLADGNYPGRMGVNTAFCFFVMGMTFGLARLFPAKAPQITLAGSMGLISVSVAALIGYLSGMESVYRWGQASRMAPQTAAGILALGVGIGVGGWRILRLNRRLWLAGITGVGASGVAMLIWSGALADHHRTMQGRAQTTATEVTQLSTTALDQTLQSVARFGSRWEPGCRNLPAICEQDLARYFRDIPELTSLEWVDRASGTVVARSVSPDHRGPDPLASWHPTRDSQPFSKLVDSDTAHPLLVLAVGQPGAPYFIAVGIDPSAVFSRAISSVGSDWTVGVSVASRDTPSGQGRRDGLDATSHLSWLGNNWLVTAAPSPGQKRDSYVADWVLLAGLTIACCIAITAYFWQTNRERLLEIQALNAELELRVTRRTRDLAAVNTTLQAMIDEERRVSALLLRREDQLATAFQAGRIGAWSYTFGSDQAIWYGRLNELYGLPPDETPGTWGDLMRRAHPDDQESIRIAAEEAVAGLKEYRAEFRVVWPDGTVHWLAALGQVSRDESGKPLGIEGTNLDITARKETEDALRQSEQQIRELADAMPQIVWTATPDGNLDYYNLRWYEYTGMTVEQSRNWGWQPVLHPDDLDNCLRQWTSSVATGQDYEIEYRFKRASDGAYRWHLGRAVAVRNANGDVVRWFGTATDIEQYKQAEAAIQHLNETLEDRVRLRTAQLASANQELASTQNRLQGVLDSATEVAIVATDTQGLIEVFNTGAERMLQYRADEIVGLQTPAIFHVPAECERRSAELSAEFGRPIQGFDVFAEHARQGIFDEQEWTWIRKDGSTLETMLVVTAVRDQDGVVEGFLGIVSDITVRKSLEHELRLNNENLEVQTRRAEEANLAKSDFLAKMSHEIRTPMNAILGTADLLWESELDVEQRGYVEVFRRAGSNLLVLINDILDLSKIEAGHFDLERTDFDLEDLVDQAIELVSGKARSKGVDLMMRLAPGVGTALIGDATRLRQVIINLLGNAIKFTDSGEIVLTIQPHESGDPRRIAFSISDTGIGIPADKLASIFDAFTQADSSTTRRYGGTGLGLSISHRIVGLMGSDLTVTSTLGQGSTFRFAPLFELAPESATASVLEVGDFEGRRVLVIDDSATNRLIMCEALMAWGLTPMEMTGPAAGLAEISEAMRRGQPYSLVILDQCMPGMDGFTLAARARELDPHLPLVMLSSDSVPGDLARRKEAGLAGYALKPVKRTDLLRLICDAMGPRSVPSTGSQLAVERSNVRQAPVCEPLNILVAEDAPDNRLLVKAYLKKSPHTITFVEDGKSAVEQVSKAGFDLILMDLQMPVMDGLSATRAIRARERELGLPATAILALTADAREEDVGKSLAAGCDGHLTKPISKQRLLAAIEEYGSRNRVGTATDLAGPIVVEILDGLEELVPEYWALRKQELPEMLELLAASDFQRLGILGHNLKGSGGSFGFPELSEIGARLEQSAKSADVGSLRNGLSQFEEYISRVRLVPAKDRS